MEYIYIVLHSIHTSHHCSCDLLQDFETQYQFHYCRYCKGINCLDSRLHNYNYCLSADRKDKFSLCPLIGKCVHPNPNRKVVYSVYLYTQDILTSYEPYCRSNKLHNRGNWIRLLHLFHPNK